MIPVNALMNIQVRIIAAQAQRQMAQLQTQLAAVQSRSGTMNRGAASGAFLGGAAAIQYMKRWGNQIQWIGRQLQYNFTLPILIAGGFAIKWALDNEAAMTRVAKVYGDGTQSAKAMSNELKALAGTFEALSSRFGVVQADVINIAADWAAAGASGLALAKSTKLTIETMILGEMEAADATQALIAIQAQYGLQVEENRKGVMDLSKVIDVLNMVENQTGTTMADLITVMSKSAGVARIAGIDVQHLAAMTAALVPAAGSASQAGTGLKTIISRLLGPTAQAADVMALMGINVNSLAWQTKNGTQRLEYMAEQFSKLSDSQKVNTASIISGRWQISKFAILMQDVINKNGYYQKALKSSASEAGNFKQRQRELNQVLDSSPRKLQIIWATIQNALARVIQPLMPAIIMIANSVASLVRAFANLNPQTQKFVIIGLALLAVIGPITRYTGSIVLLFTIMLEVTEFLATRIFILGFWVGKLSIALFFLARNVLASTVLPVLKVVGAGFLWFGKQALIAGAFVAGVFTKEIATALVYLQLVGIAAFGNLIRMITSFATAVLGGGLIAAFRMVGTAAASALSMLVLRVATTFTVIPRIMYAARSAMVTIWLAGMYALEAITTVARVAIGGAWIFLNLLMIKISSSLMATLRGIWAAGMASLGVITAAARTIIAAPWTFLSLLMIKIWAVATRGIQTMWLATQIALVTITTAVRTAFMTAWTAIGVGLLTIWAAVQRGIRAMWVATWSFLASGKAILGVLTSVRALGAKLIPLASSIGTALFAAFSGPWGWIALAIVAAIALIVSNVKGGFKGIIDWFKSIGKSISTAFAPVFDWFGKAIDSLIRAFYKLPESVQKVFLTVLRVISQVAQKIHEWFSYMNPFAKHSPSLVESTQKGMKKVGQHYQTADLGGTIAQSQKDVEQFKRTTASIQPQPFANERADLSKVMPQALPQFDKLVQEYKVLNALAEKQNALVNAQQAIVDKWKLKLDAANAALDKEQAELDKLQKNLDTLTTAYQAHQDALDNFANAPIEGMKAMGDAIFENQMEQKKLQLQIAQWEQVNGSIEDTQQKMAALAGEIEKLRGEATDLRLAGAGTDILGPINSQIDQMQAAYNAMQQQAGAGSPIADLQAQLAALQKQGEILDLQNSIQFDPLIKQIQDLANAQQELPFDEIIAGITNEKNAMAALQPQIDAATAAVAAQQAAVDKATASRDAIQARYDAENNKLQILKDTYDQITNAIQNIEDALNRMGSAASTALQKAGGAAGGAAAGIPAADFPDVGGTAKIGREGLGEDQSKLIDEYTKQINDAAAKAMGSFGDLFEPIKKGWNKTWTWIKDNIGPVMTDVNNGISAAFQGVGDLISQAMDSSAGTGLKKFGSSVADFFRSTFGWIVNIVKLFLPDLKRIFAEIGDFFTQIFERVAPTLGKFIKQIKPLLALIGVLILNGFKIISAIFVNVLKPVLDAVIGIVDSVLNVVGGIVDFFYNFFTFKWGKLWGDVVQVFKGAWNLVYSLFKGVFGVIIGIVRGFIDGIIGFFQWLWDVLFGNSIIPDIVNAMTAAFKFIADVVSTAWNVLWTAISWIWDNIGKPVFDAIVAVIQAFATVFGWVWDNIIKPAWDALWAGISWAWENVAKPLFDFIKLEIKAWAAIFKWVWDNLIKPAWNALWTGVKWAWDNVGKPIFSGIKTIVNDFAAVFSWVWNNIIKPAWNAIWTGIQAAWNTVGKPIWDGIKTAIKGLQTVFDDIKKGISAAWDLIWSGLKTAWEKVGKTVFQTVANVIVTAVNLAIKAINLLADGFNAITGLLHINFKIGKIDPIPMPKFASGGVLPVGAGFKTNQPRAIVGEGGYHPEYVIPTDPRYRNRAKNLWAAAGKDMRMLAAGGVLMQPRPEPGGPVPIPAGKDYGQGRITDAIVNAQISQSLQWMQQENERHKSIADKAGDIISSVGGAAIRAAVKAIFWPFKTGVEGLLKLVHMDWMESIGKSLLDKVWNWIDDFAKKKDTQYKQPDFGHGAQVDRFAPIALEMLFRILGWSVNKFPEIAQDIPKVLRRLQQESGGNPNAINLWDSNAAKGTPSKGIMQVIDPTFQAYKGPFNDIWMPRDNMFAGLNYANSVYPSIAAAMDKPGGYANGGIANRPTFGWFGEAGSEVLSPLTPLWRRFDRLEAKVEALPGSMGGGDTVTNNFYGDLSFPNIKSGNDADDFVRNLKNLAGK